MRLVAKRRIPRLAGVTYNLGDPIQPEAVPGRTLSNYLARGWVAWESGGEEEQVPQLVTQDDRPTLTEQTHTPSDDAAAEAGAKKGPGRPPGSKDKKPRRRRTKTRPSRAT